MVTKRNPNKYSTGYIVQIAGKQYWHRTYKGAVNRVMANRNWASGNMVIHNIKTDKTTSW